MLDNALARTLANLSTLVLVACVIAIPIHVVQAYVFKDVLAVQEIGPEIQNFPENRQVRGVAKGDFADERNVLIIAVGLELLLLPLTYRAARRVIQVDEQGGVPGVLDAWTHLGSSPTGLSLGPIAAASAIGAVAGLLLWAIGKMLADMASADFAWLLTGMSRALAVAMFTAFLTGSASALPKRAVAARPVEKLDLY